MYDRAWIQNELLPLSPLAGCFEEGSPAHASLKGEYNVTDALWGSRTYEVQGGLSMRLGMDCYEMAGTVGGGSEQTRPAGRIPPDERRQFHTYWRNDLAAFGPRQEQMLRSFFATQDVDNSRLIMWSNGPGLEKNEVIKRYMATFPDSLILRIVDIPDLSRGTAMENSPLLNLEDAKAWVDGDLVRLLVIWELGGTWVDMDMLLTRDLAPLLEHEFVTQWDCWDKPFQALNGALMHFRKHSGYLCEAFHLMANSTPPRSPSTDWGAILYLRLHRRLLAAGVPPFKVLPSCFADPLACRLDNGAPDPFEPDRSDGRWLGWVWGSGSQLGTWAGKGLWGGKAGTTYVDDLGAEAIGMGDGSGIGSGQGKAGVDQYDRPYASGGGLEEGGALDRAMHKIFALHLHNRWGKPFPKNGWIERLLLKKYDKTLEGKIPQEL
ncbi:hypothetical protein CONPUDRAFT_108463 [Coniophora puteana RWD-64-598 SS2]|uniref:Glycosyltransferase family 32 protein n=1 Tax=Coniophora puteana (strain RWD-64-598) TaxID=741705 RepID=A0A5M3MIR2_CONPW|nr:uncharacterized protein CONPUDRAFT_108463 [Coniophora puteana RWD-64-598 SS2]EIW78511.1 hypothetical protein CONPUDRAFT_108463 [Coniophora puteana RWD-64-598 SS2]